MSSKICDTKVPEAEIEFISTPKPALPTFETNEDCGVKIFSVSADRHPALLTNQFTQKNKSNVFCYYVVSIYQRWCSTSRRPRSRRIFQPRSPRSPQQCTMFLILDHQRWLGHNGSDLSLHIIPTAG